MFPSPRNGGGVGLTTKGGLMFPSPRNGGEVGGVGFTTGGVLMFPSPRNGGGVGLTIGLLPPPLFPLPPPLPPSLPVLGITTGGFVTIGFFPITGSLSGTVSGGVSFITGVSVGSFPSPKKPLKSLK